jgi:hypothetical protein
MAEIIDPDLLNDSAADDASTEIFINTSTTRLKLNPGVGNLDATDGVRLKALYGFIKEEQKNDPLSKTLSATVYREIFESITDEFYELTKGWDWENATTQNAIRRAGWLVRNSSGNVIKHYAGIAILDAEADDQIYYDVGNGAEDFTFVGNTSEAVQVLSDPNGDGNYSDGFDRSSNITVYNRQQGQLYSSASTQANNESSLLAPKLFSLSLRSGTDLNISASDATISTTAPYTGMSITFHTTAQTRSIGGTNRDFGIIIDGNNGTKQQIYEFVQWSLRQGTDQDAGAGSLIGKLMPELLEFVGEELKTKTATNYQGGGTGVYIDNFSAIDTNSLVFVDNTGAPRAFPFVSAGFIQPNDVLQSDPDAVYFLYIRDTTILVNDNSGTPITGNVSGSGSIAFDFDYDGNTQNGRTPGTDLDVTAVALGLSLAKYVFFDFTIERTNTNNAPLSAALERQYDNPV